MFNQRLQFGINLANDGIISLDNIAIDKSSCFGNSVTGEDGLVVALAEEVGEDDRSQNSILEGDSTQDDTSKNDELGVCDNFHGRIIIGCMPGEKLIDGMDK